MMEPAEYNYDKGQDILVLLYLSGKPIKTGEIVNILKNTKQDSQENTEQDIDDSSKDLSDMLEKNMVEDSDEKSHHSKPKVPHSTINSVLLRLQKEGFVTWKKYGPVELTEKGREYASHFTNHHLIIERFLNESLNFLGEKAHSDAVAISRVISCELIQAICEKLGISHEEISTDYCAFRSALYD